MGINERTAEAKCEIGVQLLLKPREFTLLSYFDFGSKLLLAVLMDKEKREWERQVSDIYLLKSKTVSVSCQS